jgi:hypothetical protein
MKKVIEWCIALTLTGALIGALAGCQTTSPPANIQEAIATLDRYTPEYVAESNAALENTGHPDRERLAGIGVRLQAGMEALDDWANGETQEKEEQGQ